MNSKNLHEKRAEWQAYWLTGVQTDRPARAGAVCNHLKNAVLYRQQAAGEPDAVPVEGVTKSTVADLCSVTVSIIYYYFCNRHTDFLMASPASWLAMADTTVKHRL